MERNNITELKRRLLEIIKEKSYEKGEITLTSGIRSDFYIDCRQTTLHPEGSYLVGRIIYDMVKGMAVDGIGGPTLGADPIATAVSLISYLEGKPLPAFIVRKAPKGHGLGLWVEGGKNLSGGRVVIVEDVVTTGRSCIDAAKKVEEEGLKVAKIIAIVDREEGGGEKIREEGYRFRAIFKKGDVRG